ncbi:MAG TPA: LLM class flavin-dependent oxidoreductase [Candidatus Binataceae bacterium]|nr:LLM class flavin-dependent oxidoreductase [Candidatus Binataceae bacterium]
MAIKMGVSYDFRNPRGTWWRPYPQLLRDLLGQIATADRLGYDNVWVTEHHFVEDDYNPSSMTALAAIAARTERIRIGTFITLLPFQNPIRHAEDAACVDNLSNGRLELGVGQGYRADEFDKFCIPREERSARFSESLKLIERLWTQENVSFEGRFSRCKDITISPRPVQKPRPPIWIGARTEKAIKRAARRGYNLMATIGPDPAPTYLAALKENGGNPADFSIAQAGLMFVAGNRDEAWDATQEHIHYTMTHYRNWMSGGGKDLPGDDDIWKLTDPRELRHSRYANGFLVGTPDEVTKKIEALTKRFSFTHLVLTGHFPGMDVATSTKSIELFAKEVLPHFH